MGWAKAEEAYSELGKTQLISSLRPNNPSESESSSWSNFSFSAINHALSFVSPDLQPEKFISINKSLNPKKTTVDEKLSALHIRQGTRTESIATEAKQKEAMTWRLLKG